METRRCAVWTPRPPVMGGPELPHHKTCGRPAMYWNGKARIYICSDHYEMDQAYSDAFQFICLPQTVVWDILWQISF